MTTPGERVRFCNACNAVVGWYAIHCDLCGSRISETAEREGSRPTAVAQMVRSSESDLFTAQMRLLHVFLARTAELEKTVNKHVRRVRTAIERGNDAATRRELVICADRVCELEQEWEELQQSYNRQSESVEEEFLARIADLEADLELAPELQSALQVESDSFLRSLEQVQESLREMGHALDLAISRCTSRFLSFSSATVDSARTQGSILLLALGLGVVLGLLAGVSWVGLLAALAPLVVALTGLAVLGLRR